MDAGVGSSPAGSGAFGGADDLGSRECRLVRVVPGELYRFLEGR